MNNLEKEIQTSFFKKYFYNIDFNALYDNFESLYSEYSESEMINSQINMVLDKFFLLNNNKGEDMKLVFNLDFLKSLDVDKLIESYNSEKNGKRISFISNMDQTSNKNIVTIKNHLYMKNILFFIIFKYYKQYGKDLDKTTEEKLYRLLISEINEKEGNLKNDNFSHISSLYKKFVKNFIELNEQIITQSQNQLNKQSERSNLDNSNSDQRNNSNTVNIQSYLQINNQNVDLNVSNFREENHSFLSSFLTLLAPKIFDIRKNTSLNNNLLIENHRNRKIHFITFY